MRKILNFIFLFLGFVFIGILIYTTRFFVFSGNPIAQILFHAIVQIDGTSPTFIKGILLYCVIVPLVLTVLVYLLFNVNKLNRFFSNSNIFLFFKKRELILSIFFFCVSFLICTNKLELVDYIKKYTKSTTIYEDKYVDPKNVDIDFPDNKRNLIYIFLESMETSYYSKNEGGYFEEDFIKELHDMAEDNITFNNNKGFCVAPNTGWTIGGMIGEHSGTPLTIPIDQNEFVTSNKFMPGLTSLGDILENEGYHNVLMLGSDAVFGGRKFFFEKHGNYEILDYNYYCDNGKIDYNVWWGFEDFKLIEFAKEELLELSRSTEPFNLTMLTVDSHHPDGYVCDYCNNEYDGKLKNVFACTSKQIYEFINWIKGQDFYDNTTIVIAGDHTSMSTTFGNEIKDYDRNVYCTIINSPIESNVNDREYCTFDLFPTTIASLGANIKGNKLGFGTNLFSNEKTVCEEDKDYYFSKISQHSTWYDNHILYGFE